MPDIWGLAAIATKFALYLGVMTAVGSVITALLFRVVDIRRFALLFAMVGLFAATLNFMLGGAALTGDATGMVDPEMLGLLWDTARGTAFAYRLAGLGLLVVGLALGRMGLWVAVLGGLLALWSFTTVGHVSGRSVIWLDALLMVHLMAAAAWIGILTPLRRLATDAGAPEAADLGHRFGQHAAIFVPLLILAGLGMSYVLVGSVAALLNTGYGRMLLIKVAVVALLLGLAALNKMRFVPALRTQAPGAAQRLAISLTLEWLAVVAILLATAILTSVLTLPT